MLAILFVMVIVIIKRSLVPKRISRFHARVQNCHFGNFQTWKIKLDGAFFNIHNCKKTVWIVQISYFMKIVRWALGMKGQFDAAPEAER